MFEEYQPIIDEGKQKENDLIKKFQVSKEQLSLKIKAMLTEEQKKISQGCELKNYSPLEFRDEIDKLTTEFKNLITEHENNLNTLKIETNKKLSQLLGKNVIKECYKIILSGSNQGIHIKVWFTLVDRPEIGCKAGDIFRYQKCQHENTSNDGTGGSGRVITSYVKLKDQELKILNINSNFYLNDGEDWYDPKVNPRLLKQWNRWVTENKIF